MYTHKQHDVVLDEPSILESDLLADLRQTNFLHSSTVGDLGAVKSSIVSDIDVLQARDCGGKTALMLASREGRLAVVEFLVDKISSSSTSSCGCTALLYACNYNNIGVARLLLERGADSNATDIYGWTSLHCACYNDNEDLARLLLDNNADPNTANSSGWTPLMYITTSEMALLLLKRGADPTVRDMFGRSVLMHACIYNSLDVVRIILDADPAEAKVRDCYGISSLNYAVLGERLDIIRVLLTRTVFTAFDRHDLFDHGRLEFISELSRY